MAISGSAPDVAVELRGFVERYVAAWNGRDTDAMAQLITDDIVWVLRNALGEPLAFHGYSDLDVPTECGGDRRITRWIGRWAHEQRDAKGHMKFAGIRYHVSTFFGVGVLGRFPGRRAHRARAAPHPRDDAALLSVADLHGIAVF